MNSLTKILILCSFFLLTKFGFSQNPTLDSLKLLLKTAKHDTTRVKLYFELNEQCEINDIGIYAKPGISICLENLKKEQTKELKFFYLKQLGGFYNNMGYLADQVGNPTEALSYYQKALDIQEEIGDKKGASYSLNNMGYVYNNLIDIPKSLEYYHKGLKLQEEIKDTNGIAISFINIGFIHRDQGDLKKALEYYHKSLKLKEMINDKEGIAVALINIASANHLQGNKNAALETYDKCYKIYSDLNDKYGMASTLVNIGYVYQEAREYEKALEHFNKAFKIQEEIEDKSGMAVGYANIASSLFHLGDTKTAQQKAEQSLKMNQELGYPEAIGHASSLLSRIYYKSGDYKKAYEMHVLYKEMSDSLRNENNRKSTIQKGFQYAYEKKATADSLKVAEERKVNDAKFKQERTQRYALYGGLVLVIFFAAFVYNRFKLSQKQKGIIQTQKHIVEEKQKEIIESITYAKSLQEAILPPIDLVTKHLPDSFVFYKPKDIVAGDFYWMHISDNVSSDSNSLLIAAADCTGHGVPGAMVSVVCSNALNRAVNEFQQIEPGKILDKTRELVIETFEKSGRNVMDGMDISLVSITKTENNKVNIKWSGANNPLWYIDNNQLNELKPDKQPIGSHLNPVPFKTHSITLDKGTMLYLFTDGFADQFGGPNGKKYKYKQFAELLIKHHQDNPNKQLETIAHHFESWKGNLEQIDDVCVIGIRV